MEEQARNEIEQSLEEAAAKGLYRSVDIRPGIKLRADAPKISICIPMGDKDDPSLFVCRKCKHRHFGSISCPECGKDVLPHVRCPQCGESSPADHKLRHAGLAPVEWLLNAWQIVPPLLCSMQVQVRKSVLSAQARNEMTYEAIKSGCKYIFFWDDDTIIPPKAIYELHNMMERHPEAGIISGVYVTREPCPEPIMYKGHGEGAYWDFDTTPGNLVEIFGAGAGCMMARVEALEDVERLLGGPWWLDEHDFPSIDSGAAKILWGHDIRFCDRMWQTGQRYRENAAGEHDPAGPRRPWKVYGAGWIQCFHFDVATQTMFGLPEDAPCFQKNKNANTTDYWDHIWNKEGFENGRVCQELYDRIAQYVPPGSNVIDLGCGIGALMDFLTKKRKVYSYGYDFSEKAIEMLRTRWLEGEAMDLADFQLDHFNPVKETIVVSTETIEHLDDLRLDHVLREASKAKKAIFSTPAGELPGTPPGEHVQIFKEDSLKERLGRYFEEVVIEKVQPHFLLAVCSGKKGED